ncbi:MAG: MFS transporter [Sulfurimicrobium sp.]|nr:MFS transporter [Sulfurimicrobium sp.]MDO9189891.1 MFS transporter [Sulfurimicrobium sp.]MDP1704052.1 MFS transporter [Sulfurimicrobium sp.]MDP2198146.1 MFS transporter [Sulfurimicrobium sp.]MDP3686053.1 MFS transporter [Sulfurimicrobium sp.]
MSAINALSRLPSAVWLLGLVSLLNDSASELVYSLLALATSWPMVLTLRFADRVGKGLRSSPRDALLALSVVPEQRGLAFGVHRAMDNAGAVIGPLLVAWLLWPLFAFYGLFLAATEGAEKALVANLAPKELLGTAYGWFNLTAGFITVRLAVARLQRASSIRLFGVLRGSRGAAAEILGGARHSVS